MPALPSDFFTLNSMLTLAGCTGATFVVTNGIQKALDFNPRWLGLVVAEVILVGGTFVAMDATKPVQFADIFVAVINGFLVYLTAAGGTQAAATATGTTPSTMTLPRGANDAALPQIAVSKRKFLTPWF